MHGPSRLPVTRDITYWGEASMRARAVPEGRPVRCGELKKGTGSAPAWVQEKASVKPAFSCTLNYTYSRTALYQELDELCRLVDKFKHRGLL